MKMQIHGCIDKRDLEPSDDKSIRCVVYSEKYMEFWPGLFVEVVVEVKERDAHER